MVGAQDDFDEGAVRLDESADAGVVDCVGDVKKGEGAGLDFVG